MRGNAAALEQKAKADVKDMFDDTAPPVLHAKHPRKRPREGQRNVEEAVEEKDEEEAIEEKDEEEAVEQEPVVDAEGNINMAIGDLVAVWLGEQEAGWCFAIGEYRGAPPDSEDLKEEEEGKGVEEEGGKGDGNDDVVIVVQWYGNNTAEASGYGPSSTYWPGWRDSADLEHPLTFCTNRPKVGGRVRGPVFRYSAVVPASSVALHGFVLERGKLQSDTKRALRTWDKIVA
jgi:hypothetical protein